RRKNDVAKRLRTVLTVDASFPKTRRRGRRPGNPRQHSVLAGGRVLAGQLGRRPFLLLLLPLEPCLPCPRALEAIAHAEAEPAQAVRLQLDLVAVLEGAEPPVVGAGGEDVAGLERVDGGDPLDAPGNLVRHVAGVEVLLEHRIDPEPNLEVAG